MRWPAAVSRATTGFFGSCELGRCYSNRIEHAMTFDSSSAEPAFAWPFINHTKVLGGRLGSLPEGISKRRGRGACGTIFCLTSTPPYEGQVVRRPENGSASSTVASPARRRGCLCKPCAGSRGENSDQKWVKRTMFDTDLASSTRTNGKCSVADRLLIFASQSRISLLRTKLFGLPLAITRCPSSSLGRFNDAFSTIRIKIVN
jgi:hypothetical protein